MEQFLRNEAGSKEQRSCFTRSLYDSDLGDHLCMDVTIVGKCTNLSKRVAKGCMLLDESAILHAVSEGNSVGYIVLVRPRDRCTYLDLNVSGLKLIVDDCDLCYIG